MNIPKSVLFLELGWEPINDYLDGQSVFYFASVKLQFKRLCKLVLMVVEYSNSSSGWTYLDNLKFVFNNIGIDHCLIVKIISIYSKHSLDHLLKKREFECVNKNRSLKTVCIFQGKQPYLY